MILTNGVNNLSLMFDGSLDRFIEQVNNFYEEYGSGYLSDKCTFFVLNKTEYTIFWDELRSVNLYKEATKEKSSENQPNIFRMPNGLTLILIIV